jgi:hypothetical protein
MKSIYKFLPALILAIFTLAGCATATPDWQTFTSPEGDFSVDMPGNPVADNQESSTDQGSITVHLYTVRIGNSDYIVAYSDYPEGMIAATGVQAFLDDIRNNAINNTKGKLLAEETIELNGNPGRSLRVESPDGTGIAQARMLLVGNRLYQVFVATEKVNAETADVQRFLNSFTLLK